MDRVKLAELTVCRDDHGLGDGVATRTAPNEADQLTIVKHIETLPLSPPKRPAHSLTETLDIKEERHSQMVDRLMHSHFIVGGVSFCELPNVIRL